MVLYNARIEGSSYLDEFLVRRQAGDGAVVRELTGGGFLPLGLFFAPGEFLCGFLGMIFVPALGVATVGSLVKEGWQNGKDDDEQNDGKIDPFLQGCASFCPSSATAIRALLRNHDVLVKGMTGAENDATATCGQFLFCMTRVLIQKIAYSVPRKKQICLCGGWTLGSPITALSRADSRASQSAESPPRQREVLHSRHWLQG